MELFHSTDVIEIDIEGVEIISTVSANGGNKEKEEAKKNYVTKQHRMCVCQEKAIEYAQT